MLKKFLFGLLVLVVLAQFIQPPKNEGKADGPDDISQAVAVPDSINRLLRAACYDCHSNHTRYPWYSRITPVNWWLRDHIVEGRKQLNFSEFAAADRKHQDHQLEEVIETVKAGSMPLDSYVKMHEEARLSPQQRAAISSWAAGAREELKQR